MGTGCSDLGYEIPVVTAMGGPTKGSTRDPRRPSKTLVKTYTPAWLGFMTQHQLCVLVLTSDHDRPIFEPQWRR